jgi:hypothetical protein
MLKGMGSEVVAVFASSPTVYLDTGYTIAEVPGGWSIGTGARREPHGPDLCVGSTPAWTEPLIFEPRCLTVQGPCAC